METPQDESSSEQEAAEQLKRAFALLERHPEFPSVEVQIHDNDQETKRSITAEEKERLTEPRLAHLIKFLDNRGAAYLRLVTDLESVKALTVIMAHFARATWWQLSGGVPIESVPPTSPFDEPHATQSQRDRILERANHWVMEGYRRIAELRKGSGENPGRAMRTRRGYRQEVEAWMQRTGVESQKQAARRLGVSIDVLKSIMSNKGRPRYSPETLADVLEKIGHKPESQ